MAGVIEGAKAAVIAQLIALAGEIAVAAAGSVLTFRLSDAAGLAATALTRITVREILDDLKRQLIVVAEQLLAGVRNCSAGSAHRTSRRTAGTGSRCWLAAVTRHLNSGKPAPRRSPEPLRASPRTGNSPASHAHASTWTAPAPECPLPAAGQPQHADPAQPVHSRHTPGIKLPRRGPERFSNAITGSSGRTWAFPAVTPP